MNNKNSGANVSTASSANNSITASGANVYKTPLLFLEETASKVIEKKLGFSSRLQTFTDTRPTLGLGPVAGSANLNQSKFDMPTNTTNYVKAAHSNDNSPFSRDNTNSGSETASDEENSQSALYIDEQRTSADNAVHGDFTAKAVDEDKPLNLSATTTTTTTASASSSSRTLSNQQIIDCYIDKLLSNSVSLDHNTGGPNNGLYSVFPIRFSLT